MERDYGREIVSILHAAAIVGVSRRTIYNWLAQGKVECVRTAGGRVRIYADTLFTAFHQSKAHEQRHGQTGEQTGEQTGGSDA